MCIKTDHRIECVKCGYPYSEAMYPDDIDNPLPCDSTEEEIHKHIKETILTINYTSDFGPEESRFEP